MKKWTEQEFIDAANKVHNNKYTYHNTGYTGTANKVKVTCPIHGVFESYGGNHLSGKGCKGCMYDKLASDRSSNTPDFITKASKIHGGVYDYTYVEYKNNSTKVKIGCAEHGVFLCSPANHLKGKGCRACGIESSRLKQVGTLEGFVTAATRVHGNKYDYTHSVYTKSSVKVDIICGMHGAFSSTPNNHLRGKGCPACGDKTRSESQLSTSEMFIAAATEIHGTTYSYDKVNYRGSKHKVTLGCRIHGDFDVAPAAHITNTSGCPLCAKYGYKSNRPANLYILTSGNVVKVGITNNAIQGRLRQINRVAMPHHFTVNDFVFSIDGKYIQKLETRLLKWLSEHYEPVVEVFDGCTETFQDVDLALLKAQILTISLA